MVRNGSIVLGIGLVILWIVGLADGQPHWMGWLDLLGAAITFLVSGYVGSMSRAVQVAEPIALGVGLIVLWVIGLSVGSAAGMSWANFGFGLAFVLLGCLEAVSTRGVRTATRS